MFFSEWHRFSDPILYVPLQVKCNALHTYSLFPLFLFTRKYIDVSVFKEHTSERKQRVLVVKNWTIYILNTHSESEKCQYEKIL